MEGLAFSFFPSFYEFGRGLADEARLAFYDAILAYFFDNVAPAADNPAYSVFVLVKPIIDKSRMRKRAARIGGSTKGASKARLGNHNASKPQSKTQAKRKGVGVGVGEGEGEGIGKGIIAPQDPPMGGFDTKSAFAEFWAAYPSSCPRKVDKKKCVDKFNRVLRSAKDPSATFAAIMSGLATWKRSSLWAEPQFIRAPLVWLNSESWNDAPIDADTPAAENPDASLDAEKRVQEALAQGRAITSRLYGPDAQEGGK